jgi:DNA-binding transcriptional MerR regulator
MKQQPTPNKLSITIPKQAVKELDQVESMQPKFSMPDLVEWVNAAVERFYPEANEGGDKRVSDSFTVRTLRHYQTLECLDAPEKQGRSAIYGFRHYLQALLIRKLLYLRCSPDAIRDTLGGKSNAQYKEMLFADLHITPTIQPSGNSTEATGPSPAVQGNETWTRMIINPGVELHLKSETTRMTPTERKQLLYSIEQRLKQL